MRNWGIRHSWSYWNILAFRFYKTLFCPLLREASVTKFGWIFRKRNRDVDTLRHVNNSCLPLSLQQALPPTHPSSSSSSSLSSSFSSSPLLFTTTLSLLDDISLPATGIFSFSHSLMDWLLASFFTPSIPANVSVRIDGRVAAGGEGELLPLQRKSGFPPRKPPPGNFLTREKGAADVYLYIISSATVELLNVGTSQTCRCCTWGVACWSAPRSGRFETSRHKWKDASFTWRLRIQNSNIIHSENSRKLELICFEKTRTQFPHYQEAFCRNSRVVFSSFLQFALFQIQDIQQYFSR